MTSMTFTYWCFLSFVCALGCWISCLLLSIVLIFSGLPTVAHCCPLLPNVAHCCPMLNPPMALLASCRCCSGGRQVHQNTQLTFWKTMKKNSNTKTKLLQRKASPIKYTILTFPTNCLYPSLFSRSGNPGNNSERCLYCWTQDWKLAWQAGGDRYFEFIHA